MSILRRGHIACFYRPFRDSEGRRSYPNCPKWAVSIYPANRGRPVGLISVFAKEFFMFDDAKAWAIARLKELCERDEVPQS